MGLKEFTEQANAYFSQLSQAEQYSWLAMLLGFILLIAGLVLLLW